MFWFLVVALVPLIATGAINYNHISRELIENERQGALNLIQKSAEAVDEWFNRRMSEIQLAAKTDILQSFDPARMDIFVKQVAAQSDVYEEVGIVGTDGIVMVNSNPASIGADVSDRSYFQRGMQGTSGYSEVIVSKSTGNRVICVAAPIQDSDGDVIGVIYAAINFEALVNEFLANRSDQMEHVLITLVDEQDRIQYGAYEELIGLSIYDAGLNEETLDIMIRGKRESGTEFHSLDGQQYLAAFSPIRETGYALYFTYPINQVLAGVHAFRAYMAIITAIVALLVALLSYYLSTTIAKPIKTITTQVKQIAKGDLTNTAINIAGQDEIGELAQHIQGATTSLRTIIRKVAEASEHVASSSQQLNASAEETSKATEQISLSAEQIASGAENQAQNTNHSLQTVQKMSEKMAQIAAYAQQVTELSDETVTAANEGNQAIAESIQQMKHIETTTKTASETINTLGSKSAEIQNIVAAITAIADQTNLLALNAAIEAAWAGEHGHGFVVVAEEVRKLAEQSARAAEQIRHIIQDIQQDIRLSVDSMQQGTAAVHKGSQLTEQAGIAFQKISTAIRTVYQQLQEVSAAVQQLDEESAMIVNAIENVQNIAQDFSANTQHVAAAAEEQNASMEEILASSQMLAQLADELQAAINTFKY